MKIKTDYVPADCDHLTAGKEYEAEFGIIDDEGDYLASSDVDIEWTIVQDEPQFTQEQAREMYDLLGHISRDKTAGSWQASVDELVKILESNDVSK